MTKRLDGAKIGNIIETTKKKGAKCNKKGGDAVIENVLIRKRK